MTDLKTQAQQLIELNEKRTQGDWRVINGDKKNRRCHQKVGPLLLKTDVPEHTIDFIAHTANHAPAIAQAYLDKCEEVERLRNPFLDPDFSPIENIILTALEDKDHGGDPHKRASEAAAKILALRKKALGANNDD